MSLLWQIHRKQITPAVYGIGISTGAQSAVIEGKNSITMTNCDFTVSGGNNGVMLYQSMSGDAADKDATANCSTLSMSGTTIRNGRN